MLIDLQVHTTAGSPDSYLSPEQLVESCKQVGLHGVATTEHRPYDTDAMHDLVTSAGLVFIHAREISCDGRHVLVLTSEPTALRELPVALPVEQLPSGDAIALVWAHPSAPGGSSVYGPQTPSAPPPGVFQGVEVLNGRHLHFPAAVQIATDLVDKLGCAATGGSDAHDPSLVGRCATWVDAEPSDGAAGVIDALRRGGARPVLNLAWAKRHGYDYRESLAGYLG